MIPVLKLVVFVMQSVALAAFMSLYFSDTGRGFLIYFGFLFFYSLGLQLVPYNFYLLVNVLTLTLLYVMTRILYKDKSRKQIIWGMLWCWLPMLVTEVLFFGVIRIVFKGLPLWLQDRGSLMFCGFQVLMSVVLGCEYIVILWFARRRKVSRESVFPMLPVVVSICILTYLCLCRLSPVKQRWFASMYVVFTLLLVLLNVMFVRWLQKYVKRQSALKARQLIQEEYNWQFEQLKQADVTRQRLRQFRHDLVNELERENQN